MTYALEIQVEELRAEMRAALPLAKRQRLGTATSSKPSHGR